MTAALPKYQEPAIDLEQTAQYIEALTGAADTPVTWCLLHDKKAKGAKPATLYGTLAEHQQRLEAKNRGGYGVFVAVNEVKPEARRTRDNVTAIRALFVESDHGAMRDPALAPSFTVQSARGKHMYWRLRDGEATTLFTAAQKQLAAYYDSDPTVSDLPRLMRVPGFLHQKGEPFLVTFSTGTGEAHSVSDILSVHPVDAERIKAAIGAKRAATANGNWQQQPAQFIALPSMAERKSRAAAYLLRVPSAVEGAGGDNQTFKAACVVVRDFAVDNFDDAMEVMQAWNIGCEPCWEEQELADKINHALRHGSGTIGSKLVGVPAGAEARMAALLAEVTDDAANDQAEEIPRPEALIAANGDAEKSDDTAAAEEESAPDDKQQLAGDEGETLLLDVTPAQPLIEGDTRPYHLQLTTLLGRASENALRPDVIAVLADLHDTDKEEYGRCLGELKDSGVGLVNEVKRAVRDRRLANMSAAANAKLDAAESGVVTALPAARTVVGPDHRVPKRYVLEWSGITKLVEKKQMGRVIDTVEVPVCQRPLLITGILDRADGDGQLLEMAFQTRDDKRWVKVVASRETAMTSRLLNALADKGFPVHSMNAGLLVEYLAAYETVNEKVIARGTSTVQMGWHKSKGDHVFVLGEQCLVPTPQTPPVAFVGDAAGDTHLARCYRSKGTLEGWNEAMALVVTYPRVELAVCGALATVLMDILGAPSFALDFSGQSSVGKTTTMRVAASAFGVPDERSQNSLIHSWNTTQVGLERLAATNKDLPLLMDETKQAPAGPRGRSMVPEAIYQITNGQGKARGAVQGRRKTHYWRTLMLTTGEQAAVDHSKDMGPAARVLTLWGSPFGGYSNDVAKIETILDDNYGFAGPAFVQWVVTNRSKWGSAWRQRYHEEIENLRQYFTKCDAGVASRLCKYLALIECTARLLRSAIPHMPWNGSAVHKLAPAIAANAAPFDRPSEAARHMYHLAVAERSTFFGCHDGERPPARFNGYWKTVSKRQGDVVVNDYDFVGFMPDYIENRLTGAGFDFEATMKLWHERGWLRGDGNRRQWRVYMNGEQPRVYALTREAISSALGEVEPTDSGLLAF